MKKLCVLLIPCVLTIANCAKIGFSSLDTIPPDELNARGIIYFSRALGDTTNYWAIEANGTNFRKIDSFPESKRWDTSPDKQYYTRYVYDYPRDKVCIFNDNNQIVSSTDSFETVRDFEWSHDSSRLYIIGSKTQNYVDVISSLDLNSSISDHVTIYADPLEHYKSGHIKIQGEKMALILEEQSDYNDVIVSFRQVGLDKPDQIVDLGSLPVIWERRELSISDIIMGPYPTGNSWIIGIYYDRFSKPRFWFGEISLSEIMENENEFNNIGASGPTIPELFHDNSCLYWINDVYGDNNTFCWINVYDIDGVKCENIGRRIGDYSLSPYDNQVALITLDGLYIYDFNLRKFAQILPYSFDTETEIMWQ